MCNLYRDGLQLYSCAYSAINNRCVAIFSAWLEYEQGSFQQGDS